MDAAPLDFQKTIDFIALGRLLKPTLSWGLKSHINGPPVSLPPHISDFLDQSLALAPGAAQLAWRQFAGFCWANDLSPSEKLATRAQYLHLFLKYGTPRGIGILDLRPPTRSCADPACQSRGLTEPSHVAVTVFTKDFGPIPDFSSSYYCRHNSDAAIGCRTRYYNNYYVRADKRTYYADEDIEFLQVSEHFYVERRLSELFSLMMVSSWTSATNCARTYNEGLSNDLVSAALPADWRYALKMDVDDVSSLSAPPTLKQDG
ncbi:hypothetical protein MKEN_00150700 [Mycena kentingensis (nom. inval.)]|nr:hypothetical protein MKEN_00150700 [Mycena kentingensis (nom. inval.)]